MIRRRNERRTVLATRRRARPARHGVAVGVMVAGLAAYVILHSPLRITAAHLLGFTSRGCYLCARTVTGSDVLHAAVAAELFLAATAAAAVTAARLAGERYERVLVFGLGAIGFVTIPAAAVGGLASLTGGSYLRPPEGPLLASIPALCVTLEGIRRGWRPSVPPLGAALTTTLLRVVAGCAAVLLAGSVVVSLLHPPTQGDALSYHAPISVFMWSDGNLTTMLDRAPGVWAFYQPGTAEMFYGLLRLLGGEMLADLGQLPFALLGAGAAYAFTRRTGLAAGASTLAAGAFLLMPIVALQVGTQANDVAGSALLMTAVALASAPVAEWRPERAASLGVALGLATATKLALLPGVIVVAAMAVAALARRGRQPGRPILLLAAGFVVIIAPWWIRNIALQGNPIYPQAIPFVGGHGVDVGAQAATDFEYVPRAIAWPLYPLLEPIDDRSGYGVLFVVAILPGLVACWQRGRRWPLALLGTSFVISIPLWWRYTVHEPRYLLPYAGLAAALVPWSLVAVRRRSRPLAVVVVAAAALFSVIVAFDQAILPLARQPTARAAFYDRVWAVDPVATSLQERIAILQVTGFGDPRTDYASTYPLLGRSQNRRLLPLDASTIRGSRTVILSRMRAGGVRYAYVATTRANRTEVMRLFAPPVFVLVRASAVVPAELIGARRHLFRPVADADVTGAITRYLFELP